MTVPGWLMLVVLSIVFGAGPACSQVTYEDAGKYLVEHTARATGEFRDLELILPIPLNWPMQTASEFTCEPQSAKIVLDDSETVGLAILRVPGPAKEATLTLRYTIACTPPKFDVAALEARDYPPYDEDTQDYKHFTKPARRIESDAPPIAQLGQQFAKAEAHPLKRARAIYDYVMDYMDYIDENARGALAAFNRRRGCCADYAMLFAAICRAAGIPARECGGFIAGQEDRWHSWAEFLLPEVGWVPCDPQGGDKHVEGRDANFGGLAGSPHVALSKRHDFTVTDGDVTREFGFIQSGLSRYRGTCSTQFSVKTTAVSEARYAMLFTPGNTTREVHAGLSGEQLEATQERASEAGMRCISIAVSSSPAGLVYGGIWEKHSSAPDCRIHARLSLDELRGVVSELASQGLMPISISACVHGGRPIYAVAIGSAAGTRWSSAIGIPREQFMQRLRSEVQSGRIPAVVEAHLEREEPVCSGIFAQLGGSASISAGMFNQDDRLEASLADYRQKGLLPVALAATAGHPAYFHIIAIGTGRPSNWWVERDLRADEMDQVLQDASGNGLRPTSITAY